MCSISFWKLTEIIYPLIFSGDGGTGRNGQREVKKQIMVTKMYKDAPTMGRAAARQAAREIDRCIREKGSARILLSTGASQFELFRALARETVDWSRVEVFHLDEYIGIPVTHRASFRKYLKERFADVVKPGRMRYVVTEGDIWKDIAELSRDLLEKPVDLGLVGIGENAHIAFNDPPADFTVTDPYIVVSLNEACKAQQVREGWFSSTDEVPCQAVSMSVHQILACRKIISFVPGSVKARAVLAALTTEPGPDVPAAVLSTHPDTTLYLDKMSAGLLDDRCWILDNSHL